MMRISLIFAVVISLLLPASAALAAELKVAVVDVEYVIVSSKAGKAAKKKLKKIFAKKQKDLDKQQKDLLKLKEQLENPSDMDTPDRRRKMAQEYQQGIAKLQEAFMSHQKMLQEKEMELMKPILKKLESVLTDFAKAKGLDMVLTRSQHGVVFAKPELDATEELLKKLDAS